MYIEARVYQERGGPRRGERGADPAEGTLRVVAWERGKRGADPAEGERNTQAGGCASGPG